MTKRTKMHFFGNLKSSIMAMILFTLAVVSLGGNLIAVNQAAAQDDPPATWLERAQRGGLDKVGQAYGGGEPKDVRLIVALIINIILSFLGILALVLIFYAGFKWMTAGGNEDSVATAKRILIAGVIGLVIILASWGLTTYVLEALINVTVNK